MCVCVWCVCWTSSIDVICLLYVRVRLPGIMAIPESHFAKDGNFVQIGLCAWHQVRHRLTPPCCSLGVVPWCQDGVCCCWMQDRALYAHLKALVGVPAAKAFKEQYWKAVYAMANPHGVKALAAAVRGMFEAVGYKNAHVVDSVVNSVTGTALLRAFNHPRATVPVVSANPICSCTSVPWWCARRLGQRGPCVGQNLRG
jgi:hypothetical protein